MRGVLRWLLRFAKWTFSLLLVVVLLVFVGGWFLLGTERGYQYVPGLINRFTPFTVTYADLRGQFFGTQSWQDMQITGAGLEIRLHEAVLDFAWQDLFSRQLHIRELRLADGVVALPDGDEDAAQASGEIPEQLPQIRLPIAVRVDRLIAQHVDIQKDKTSLLYVEQAEAQAHYDREGKAQLQGDATLREGQLAVTAALTTLEDYPLQLDAKGQLTLPDQEALALNIQGSGSVLKPVLEITAQGLLDADVAVQGDVNLARQTLAAQGQWQGVAYGEWLSSPKGDLQGAHPYCCKKENKTAQNIVIFHRNIVRQTVIAL